MSSIGMQEAEVERLEALLEQERAEVRSLQRKLRLIVEGNKGTADQFRESMAETRLATLEDAALEAERLGRQWGVLRSMKMTHYAEAARLVAKALRELKR